MGMSLSKFQLWYLNKHIFATEKEILIAFLDYKAIEDIIENGPIEYDEEDEIPS